jgi:hypothetical protein
MKERREAEGGGRREKERGEVEEARCSGLARGSRPLARLIWGSNFLRLDHGELQAWMEAGGDPKVEWRLVVAHGMG